MATTKELINAGLCNLENLLGTEISKGCVAQMKAAKAIWAIAPGEAFTAGADFQTEKDRLIKASKLVILRGVNTFESGGSDDAIETLADDTQIVTNEGKYQFTATFTNGTYFNRALHSIKGFRNWNIIIVDGSGIWGTKTTLGGFTGFTTGMIQPGKLQVGTNSEGQKESLSFQFLDRPEFDQDYAYIVDSSARKQLGVTQINLEFVNVPKAGDVVLTVKATLAQDRSVAFTGIDFASFKTSPVNTTAGTDTVKEGTFVLTVPSVTAGADVTVKLFEELNSVIVGPDGDYYKSNLLKAKASA